MTCTGIQRLFDAYWDDETTQAEREVVEAHLAGCPRCRERYETHAQTLEALSKLPRVEAAPDLVERVTDSARRIARAPDALPAEPRPVWVPVAAAAGVLVVGALALLPLMQPHPDRMASQSGRGLTAVRQPELVGMVHTTGATGPVAAPGGAKAPAAAARRAPLTDSLFDHTEDVEFILDPVALHRGSAATRTADGVQAESAVISF
jgi:anti-sigma factor RsiW